MPPGGLPCCLRKSPGSRGRRGRRVPAARPLPPRRCAGRGRAAGCRRTDGRPAAALPGTHRGRRPPSFPSRSRSASAASSTRPPRAGVHQDRPGFIRSSAAASSRFSVSSGVGSVQAHRVELPSSSSREAEGVRPEAAVPARGKRPPLEIGDPASRNRRHGGPPPGRWRRSDEAQAAPVEEQASSRPPGQVEGEGALRGRPRREAPFAVGPGAHSPVALDEAPGHRQQQRERVVGPPPSRPGCGMVRTGIRRCRAARRLTAIGFLPRTTTREGPAMSSSRDPMRRSAGDEHIASADRGPHRRRRIGLRDPQPGTRRKRIPPPPARFRGAVLRTRRLGRGGSRPRVIRAARTPRSRRRRRAAPPPRSGRSGGR